MSKETKKYNYFYNKPSESLKEFNVGDSENVKRGLSFCDEIHDVFKSLYPDRFHYSGFCVSPEHGNIVSFNFKVGETLETHINIEVFLNSFKESGGEIEIYSKEIGLLGFCMKHLSVDNVFRTIKAFIDSDSSTLLIDEEATEKADKWSSQRWKSLPRKRITK